MRDVASLDVDLGFQDSRENSENLYHSDYFYHRHNRIRKLIQLNLAHAP